MECDVVGFEEVFSIDSLRVLAKEAGYPYFATVDTPKVSEEDSEIFISSVVAITSKFPIVSVRSIESEVKFSRKPVVATIDFEGELFDVYTIHLKSKMLKGENTDKSNFNQRLAEAQKLHEDIQQSKNHIVVLGDFNDSIEAESLKILTSKRLIDAYVDTTGRRTPTNYYNYDPFVIDYILITKELEPLVSSYEVFNRHLMRKRSGDILESDHAQVVCEISL